MSADLVALLEVKSWLSIPPGNTGDDALLSTLITQVSEWIDNYCNRNFDLKSYQTVRDGHGGNRMFITQQPIASVTSVMVNGVSIPASSDGIFQYGYTFDSKTITLVGAVFSRGLSNIALSYTAGYSSPPAEVVMVAKKLVAWWYRERAWIGKTSESGLNGQSTAYFHGDEAPADILRTLDSYNRRVPEWS